VKAPAWRGANEFLEHAAGHSAAWPGEGEARDSFAGEGTAAGGRGGAVGGRGGAEGGAAAAGDRISTHY
jgi:hypothetical protein